MKTAKWVSFGIAILSGAASLLLYLVPQIVARFFMNGAKNVGTIGIIGGADGPASIWVSSGSTPQFLIPAVFVISLISWLFLRAKSK